MAMAEADLDAAFNQLNVETSLVSGGAISVVVKGMQVSRQSGYPGIFRPPDSMPDNQLNGTAHGDQDAPPPQFFNQRDRQWTCHAGLFRRMVSANEQGPVRGIL